MQGRKLFLQDSSIVIGCAIRAYLKNRGAGFPLVALYDSVNVMRMTIIKNTKVFKSCALCSQSPYRLNLGGGKLGLTRAPATFLNHIMRVVFLRSKKQVGGIYAGWIITAMKDTKTVGDYSVVNLPRDLVRSTSIERTVALRHACCPLPAFALWPLSGILIDLRPKTFLQGSTTSPFALGTTEDSAPEFYLRRKLEELVAAKLTVTLNTWRVSSLEAIATSIRTKASAPTINIIGFSKKRGLTVFTSAWYRFLSHDVNLLRRFALRLEPLERVCVPAA